MKTTELQRKILKTAVKNMIDFGYVHVTEENIVSGKVERMFFRRMLQQARSDAMEQGAKAGAIEALDNLIRKCDEADDKEATASTAQILEGVAAAAHAVAEAHVLAEADSLLATAVRALHARGARHVTKETIIDGSSERQELKSMLKERKAALPKSSLTKQAVAHLEKACAAADKEKREIEVTRSVLNGRKRAAI